MTARWKDSFAEGVASFRASRLEDALKHFTDAIEHGGDKQHVVYDARAAALEKLSRPKDALRDVKQTIQLEPTRWQGYSRAARLFYHGHKFDSSIQMANLALERLKSADSKPGLELRKLILDASDAQARAATEQRRRVRYHFGKLPVEIITEVFHLTVDTNYSVSLATIGGVSTEWRNIACHTPSLWDKLILTHRKPQRKAALWIERSQGRIRQLFVRKALIGDHTWSFALHLRGLKWECIRNCQISGWNMEAHLNAISKLEVLRRIHELELTDLVPGAPADRHIPADAQLRVLRLNGVRFEWSSIARCQHLRRLEITSNCNISQDFLTVLERNPALEILSLNVKQVGIFSRNSSDTTAICLSRLSFLQISGFSSPDSLFRDMSFPALRTLSITYVNHSTKFLQHLTQAGVDDLRVLSITDSPLSIELFLRCLEKLPSIERLELKSLYDSANKIVDAISKPLPPPPPPPFTDMSPAFATGVGSEGPIYLCPNLKALDVSCNGDMKTGPLVRLIRSRLPQSATADSNGNLTIPNNVARLLHLKVDECPQIEVEWLPWFKENVHSFSCVYMTKKGARWRR